MKLFVWKSEAIGLYLSDTIVVMAETVDDARRLVREKYSENSYRSKDDLHQLEIDLSNQPKIHTETVAFLFAGGPDA